MLQTAVNMYNICFTMLFIKTFSKSQDVNCLGLTQISKS